MKQEISIKVKRWGGAYVVVIRHAGKRKTAQCATEQAANELAEELRVLSRAQDAGAVLAALSRPAGGGSPTVADFAARFLKQTEQSGLSRATKRQYRLTVKAHVLPAFGPTPVQLVTRAAVKEWVIELRDRQARGTVAHTLALLRTILQEAVDDGAISVNPASDMARHFREGKDKEEVTPFDAGEIKAILDYFLEKRPDLREEEKRPGLREKRPDLYPLVYFLKQTGCRIGEALALEWGDINWRKGQARIDKQAERFYDPNDRGRYKAPKTRAGRRWIDLSPDLVAFLKAEQTRWKERRLRFGEVLTVSRLGAVTDPDPRTPDPRTPDLVFSISGRALPYTTVFNNWEAALKKLGIRQRGPHHLRHTFASNMLQRGCGLLWLSNQLGHKTPRLTLEVYSQWMPPAERSRDIELIDEEPGAAGENVNGLSERVSRVS